MKDCPAKVGQLKGHQAPVKALAFSPDGTTLASAGQDRTVRLWNVNTRQETASLSGHQDEVNAVPLTVLSRENSSGRPPTSLPP